MKNEQCLKVRRGEEEGMKRKCNGSQMKGEMWREERERASEREREGGTWSP